jgi:hypothetical protein
MESKYNVAIERSVILEGEMKAGDQEREDLRIEVQRLRDELSDLKVEAEIRQDKLRHAEAATKLQKPTPISTTNPRPQSSLSEHSPTASASPSPSITTPPTKSVSSATSDAPTPPSPQTSDKSAPAQLTTPAQIPKSRLSITNSATPRPSHYSARPPRHSRGPSLGPSTTLKTPANRRTTLNRGEVSALPSSTSLTQIRGLIGKMQKLESRVHAARSKLPAPTSTPPRGSPRPGSSLSNAYVPSNITVRSSRKRTSTNLTSDPSLQDPATSIESTEPARPASRTGRPGSRLSFGIPPPTPTQDLGLNTGVSRPSSRASLSSRQSISHLPRGQHGDTMTSSRPSSRQSMTGSRTPLGHYPTQAERIARPRSSMGGFNTSQGHSGSVSRLSNYEMDESPEIDAVTPTPSRRTTFGKDSGTAIPVPGGRRTSGVGMTSKHIPSSGRRISAGQTGEMGPPERKERKKLSGVGETY